MGSVECARLRKFRQQLEHWLDSVLQIWPECRARISTKIVTRNSTATPLTGTDNAVLGAGDGIRTRDINLGKVALYQLSYSRLRLIDILR